MKKVFFFFKIFYLLIFRGEGREKERNMTCERNISQMPLAHPQPGTWSTTQTCALIRNQTSNLSLWGLTPNSLSHPSQGMNKSFERDRLKEKTEPQDWGQTVI